MNMAFPT